MTILRKADVPADRPKWIVTQPDDFAAFEDGLTNQAAESNLSMFLPATAEQVMRAGYMGMYKGANVFMTNRRPGSGNVCTMRVLLKVSLPSGHLPELHLRINGRIRRSIPTRKKIW